MGLISKECALVLAVVLVVPSVWSYEHYRGSIPNGYNVPNPFGNDLWLGVGHWEQMGGGPRNPFGLAFAANNHVWDETLCNMDSDLDGRTNGVELCDPDCTWSEGDNPSPECTGNNELSHPGLCEPVDDPVCIELNEDANYDEFVCESASEEGMQTFDIRAHLTEIPDNRDTTYYCQLHELPSDQDYHVIGNEPLIDTLVIHHIEVYACTEEELRANNNYVWDTYGGDGTLCRELAGMYCSHAIALWTIGLPGHCLDHGDFGYRIGSEYKWALVEHHWNNPEKASGLTDTSGLRLYYTPNLRTHDLGTYQVVEFFLNIPPHTEVHQEVAVCGPECSTRDYFPEDCIEFLSANIHMHLLGHSGSISITNSSGVTTTIASLERYNYYNPVMHYFYPPVKVCPGDTVTVECNFTTKYSGIDGFTHFGESAYEEMCVGYITYYPRMPGIVYCIESGEIGHCETNGFFLSGDIERGCDAAQFLVSSVVLRNIAEEVASAPECARYGCSDECLEYLKCTQYTKHNCMKYDDIRYVMYQYLLEGFFDNYVYLGEKMRDCYLKDPADSFTCE